MDDRVLADKRAQMDAFDKLGPKTRVAVANSPIDVNAWKLLAIVESPIVFSGRLKTLPPDDPAIEALVVKTVAQRVGQRLGHPCDLSEYVIRRDPRRGREGARRMRGR